MNHDKELLVAFLKFHRSSYYLTIDANIDAFLASDEYKALGEGWISVEERLPEKKQHVLVIRSNPNIVTTGYIHEYGHWIWSNLNGSTHKADNIYKVTHWQPLPHTP